KSPAPHPKHSRSAPRCLGQRQPSVRGSGVASRSYRRSRTALTQAAHEVRGYYYYQGPQSVVVAGAAGGPHPRAATYKKREESQLVSSLVRSVPERTTKRRPFAVPENNVNL